MQAEQLSEIIGLIYDAALEGDRWEDFLYSFSDFVGGSSGTMIFRNHGSEEQNIYRSVRLDPMIHEYFASIVPEGDYWFEVAETLPGGTPLVGSELVPLDVMERRVAYQEAAGPAGVYYLLGAVIENSPLHEAYFSIHRPHHRDDFSSEHKRVINLLIPHLQRALRVHGSLGQIAQQRNAMDAALDRLPFGVVLCDESATVVYANATAQEMFRVGTGVLTHSGTLGCRLAADGKAIRRAVNRASTGRDSRALLLRDEDGHPCQQVLVAPVARRSTIGMSLSSPSVAVLVYDISTRADVDVDKRLLRQVFDLTPAECRVASALITANDLQSTARRLNISKNTLKSQARQVYRKCEVGNRAELIRMLVRSALQKTATD